MAQKDLAGNVFASMDKDLSAESEDGEENVGSCEDQQTPELENLSAAHPDELASSIWENIDEASVNEDDIASAVDDDDDDDENADADTGTEDGDAESDFEINAGDASDISGKILSACYVCLPVFLVQLLDGGLCDVMVGVRSRPRRLLVRISAGLLTWQAAHTQSPSSIIGTGRWAVTLFGWEGNCMPGGK